MRKNTYRSKTGKAANPALPEIIYNATKRTMRYSTTLAPLIPLKVPLYTPGPKPSKLLLDYISEKKPTKSKRFIFLKPLHRYSNSVPNF